MRRQQSASRVLEGRDTYDQGKSSWKDSLRGASKARVEADTRNQRKHSRSHSVQGRQPDNVNYSETRNGRLLDPGLPRRFVIVEKLLII